MADAGGGAAAQEGPGHAPPASDEAGGGKRAREEDEGTVVPREAQRQRTLSDPVAGKAGPVLAEWQGLQAAAPQGVPPRGVKPTAEMIAQLREHKGKVKAFLAK